MAGYGVNFTFTFTDMIMDDQPYSGYVAKTQPFFNPDPDAGNRACLWGFWLSCDAGDFPKWFL